jgi:predicted phosphodiesterase
MRRLVTDSNDGKAMTATMKALQRLKTTMSAWVEVTLAFGIGCSTLHGAAPLFTKGPYLQMPGTTTMAVMWESATNCHGMVRFGRDGALNQRLGPVVPREMVSISPDRHTNLVVTVTNGLTVTKTNVVKGSRTNAFLVYQATLTGLSPGSIYTYVVEVGGQQTPPRAFRTFSAKPDITRFVAYGDSRSNPKIHRKLADQFGKYSPEFVLHSGDLVMAGKDYGLWSKEFFDPLIGVADRVPILPVPGNHEEDLKNYRSYFPVGGSNRWYSFDAGPVHVLALDYHFESTTNEQFRFAQKDLLESTAPWKIVFLHYPVFNYGHHNSGWGHRSYLPLFHEARVDLVLAGHTHMYERMRPVAPANQPGAWAIACITTGGGGAELHQPHPHPAQALAVPTNHFITFAASRDTLLARAIRVDGVEIDSFEIRKPGGKQSAEYRAQIYPEELLKLSYEVGLLLLGKLAALPTNQEPILTMLTLPPLMTAPRPVELEITLTKESARYYAMEEQPLRVTTPAPGGTNKVVWLNVRSLGKRKIKGPELNPPLVFKARVTTDGGETLAYGPLSRTSRTAASLAKKLAATHSAVLLAEPGTSPPGNTSALPRGSSH